MVKKFGIQNTSFNSLKTEEIFNKLQSEDSPHKSGIKTQVTRCRLHGAGCRKTRPTNRGLRPYNCKHHDDNLLSEDSPHKSGIKTESSRVASTSLRSEDSPHKSGIKTE